MTVSGSGMEAVGKRRTVDDDYTVGVGHEILATRADDAAVRLKHEGSSTIEKRDTGLVYERTLGAEKAVISSCSPSTLASRAYLDERPTRMLYVLERPSQHLSQELKR